MCKVIDIICEEGCARGKGKVVVVVAKLFENNNYDKMGLVFDCFHPKLHTVSSNCIWKGYY